MFVQVGYCEEQVECRRVLLLSHFGESGFTSAACHGTCDICVRNKGQVFTERDMTQAAHDLIRVLLASLPCSCVHLHLHTLSQGLVCCLHMILRMPLTCASPSQAWTCICYIAVVAAAQAQVDV